jgi:hypothetical protein
VHGFLLAERNEAGTDAQAVRQATGHDRVILTRSQTLDKDQSIPARIDESLTVGE